jgi:hypothetical protein
MDSVEQDDRDDIVWSDAQAMIRGLEEQMALLARENEVLRAEVSRRGSWHCPVCSGALRCPVCAP